jgi:hypothetical protein
MCFTRTRPLTVKTTRAPRTDRSILSIFVFGEPGLTWVLGSAHLVGSPRNSRASHNYAKLLKTGVRWSRVFGNFRNLVTARGTDGDWTPRFRRLSDGARSASPQFVYPVESWSRLAVNSHDVIQ